MTLFDGFYIVLLKKSSKSEIFLNFQLGLLLFFMVNAKIVHYYED